MTPIEFEHRIAEIHTLLESDGAVVTWSDRIPDPDNADQLRQIDISIKRDGRIAHIECRHRQKPEDTTWIESLIGRQLSLGADAMIGVSSSGFTAGAIKKASAFGIFLFELAQLTTDEIASWGKSSQVEVFYFDLFELEVQPVLISMPSAKAETLGREFLGPPNMLDLLLNQIRYELNRNRDITAPYCFFLEAQAHNMMLGGIAIDRVRIRGVSRLRKESVSLPSVYTYTDLINDDRTLAHLEATADDKMVIAKTGNKVHVVVSMSGLPPPKINSISGGVIEFDFGQATQPPFFKIVGSPEHVVQITGFDFSVSVIGLHTAIP
jgi:Restriction endonuclease